MTLLQDLKNEIYRELNVETTVQVKELYPSYNLRRTSDWLELKAELVAKATETQSEAFPTTPGASTGETSDASVGTNASAKETVGVEFQDEKIAAGEGYLTDDGDFASYDDHLYDLEPDLTEPEPFDGAAWADFVRRTNPKATVIAEVIETDEEVGEVLTMPSVDPEAVADEVPESDAPMAPIPVALWDFMPGHNLVAVLSPWVHYLQWLDRLYTNVSIAFESTFGSYQNA